MGWHIYLREIDVYTWVGIPMTKKLIMVETLVSSISFDQRALFNMILHFQSVEI